MGEAYISWPKRTAPISAQPRGRPMWPELAFLMESMARPRASSAACGEVGLSSAVLGPKGNGHRWASALRVWELASGANNRWWLGSHPDATKGPAQSAL
eukprot:scaffold76719_cov72-Phaeocystis_antarctica.AAC.1